MKIIDRLKRNPCKDCKFYNSKYNTCQSKKSATYNPYVNKLDKLFCEPYKEVKKNDNR